MRRAPFVIGATGAGLGLLFSFHTKPIHVSIASSASSSSPSGSTTTSPPGGSPSTTVPPSGGTAAPTSPPTTAAQSRTATGDDVQYMYGDIELRVTERGTSITNIQVVAEGATDPRSAEINSQAVPLLQQQAMSAQSTNIDGVSGATFTSQAYVQALQSALDRLKA